MDKYHGIMSVYRMSRRLSRDVLEYFNQGKSGDYRCVIPTLCITNQECEATLISKRWIGSIRLNDESNTS